MRGYVARVVRHAVTALHRPYLSPRNAITALHRLYLSPRNAC